MAVINTLMNITCRGIVTVFSVVSYYFMASRSVSIFLRRMARFFSCGGMVSIMILITQENNLLGFRRGSQSTNIVSRGNRNSTWKRISGIAGYFVWSNIIKRNGSDIQIWTAKINWKGIAESVINCPVVVLYHSIVHNLI